MRLYKPDNATVLKGALRNLLDGSRTTSIKHFVNKAEDIHQNFFDDFDAYDMSSFLQLYKQGATIILYNRDNHLLTSRGPDTDFIIVKGNTVKAYDTGAGLEVFSIENYEANPNDLYDVENFLDSFWRYLSVGWNRSIGDGYRLAAVMAFDDNGNFLLPSEVYPYVYDGDIESAGFSFWKEEDQPIDNTEKHAVNSNTQTIENKGKNAMTKIANIVAANKSAVVNAAKLEAGKIALTQITKVAAKKAPFIIKGYIDTPIGRVVIANLLSVAVDQYSPSNQKAKAVADAAMEAAMLEMVQSFNIAEMIDEMVKGIDISTFTVNTENE
ncbi:hypothetical protein HdH2rev_00194 [Escherichia phage vB_EcoS_HdH2]|uniref:Uncharacterized protein n=1 Tax=Escherichia phage vB_EcoS_HdH2 TaxID=2508174 RepID=A0A482N5G7_9CAUD|nr:hypothetical protein HWC04_gp010 [Escherichia phage vB_EcoS_HdH2]YP_009843489.1 hypothetical protein HWC04_gp066 [Escherichia phage vB_EcoS_HdH2]QBQ81108.1 hypothetical protein HdH2rev_00010 [Escherichia phage vB_EcoS_HdH2]QBQ81268.1 hypothetical protein HdH2rev_00194 [Escherichia phage vB_EcoS_HdH2]